MLRRATFAGRREVDQVSEVIIMDVEKRLTRVRRIRYVEEIREEFDVVDVEIIPQEKDSSQDSSNRGVSGTVATAKRHSFNILIGVVGSLLASGIWWLVCR